MMIAVMVVMADIEYKSYLISIFFYSVFIFIHGHSYNTFISYHQILNKVDLLFILMFTAVFNVLESLNSIFYIIM